MTTIPDNTTIQGNLTVEGTVQSSSSSDGLNMPSLTSDPSTLTLGELWYNSSDGVARVYTASGITDLGGTAAGSLDAAYNGGSNITVDTAAIAITSTLTGAAFTIENNTITSGTIMTIDSSSLTTGKGLALTADALTSGDLLYLDTLAAGLTSGNYIHCYDGTATDFKVAAYGATTIAGNGGSTVLTITAGDAVMSDGSLSITDADNATTLSVINATISTGTAASITLAALTTGKGLSITCDAATTGDILYLDNGGASLTTGYFINCNDDDSTQFGVGKGGSVTISIPNNYNVDAITIAQADATNNKDVIVTTNSGTGNDLNITNTGAGATGVVMKTNHDSASPANNDVIFRLSNYGDDAGGNSTEMARIDTKVLDTTTASEDTEVSISTITNATLTQSAVFTGSTIAIGSGAADGVVQSDGNYNLTLQTGNSTTSSITIVDGANGDIQLNPNGTGDILITSTSAGAAGPIIHLHHNTASPAASDVMGKIEFDMEDASSNQTEAAKIEAIVRDTTADSEDADLVFSVIRAATLTQQLQLDSDVNGIIVGDGAATAIVQSNGNYDLQIQTGNATTATMVFTDGANGDITTTLNGTGQFIVTSAGAIASGEAIVSITNTGTPAASDSYLLELDATGLTATNHPTLLGLNGAGKDCIGIAADIDGATNDVFSFNCGGAVATGKSVFKVTADGTPAAADSLLVELDYSGATMTNNPLAMLLKTSGTGGALKIDQNGNGESITIDSEATTANVITAEGAAVTTGNGLHMNSFDALTTGSIASFESDSSDNTARNLVEIINNNTGATGTVPFMIQQDAPTSTNYFKVAVFAGVTLWMGNGTTANGTLSGTAGDIIFNAGSNKPEYCTGTTNWTALV